MMASDEINLAGPGFDDSGLSIYFYILSKFVYFQLKAKLVGRRLKKPAVQIRSLGPI